MAAFHTICYVSTSNPSLSKEEIQLLFKQVSETNHALGLTGFLTYSFGRFFQVLEGDPKDIFPLYENHIKKDLRHTEIFEVFNRSVPKRVFLDYSSKFKVVTKNEELQHIETYLNAYQTDDSSDKISRILKPFLLFD
jgi:hypothetical protein